MYIVLIRYANFYIRHEQGLSELKKGNGLFISLLDHRPEFNPSFIIVNVTQLSISQLEMCCGESTLKYEHYMLQQF